jgi:hypothetical protein
VYITVPSFTEMGSCELFTELALNNNPPDLCSTEQVGLQESATALLVIFQTGLRLSAWMVSDLNPPASASHITGITGIPPRPAGNN